MKPNIAKWFLSGVLSVVIALAPYLPVAVVPLALSQSACNASWIQTALNDLPVLINIATSILGIVGAAQGQSQIDPALAAQVQTIGAQVKADLQTVQSLVTSYQSAAASAKPGILTTIDVSLSAVQSNLGQLLTAFHVNSAALQATVSTALSLAMATVMAIESLVPPPPSPTPASQRAHAAGPVKPMTASQLRQTFNQIVSANGYSQYALQ